jgi:hypothetical protein
MSEAFATLERFRQGAGAEGSGVLYLVKPTGLEWTGNVGQEVVDFAREHKKDLGTIEDWWLEADTKLNEDHVRSALRWGIESARGIVVAAQFTVALQRPHELRKLVAENGPRMRAYRESPQVKMIDEYLESQMPGWKAQGKKADEGVERALADSLEEAVADAERELRKADVRASLRSHWLQLGGVVPDPE